jgi:hypothetical protein
MENQNTNKSGEIFAPQVVPEFQEQPDTFNTPEEEPQIVQPEIQPPIQQPAQPEPTQMPAESIQQENIQFSQPTNPEPNYQQPQYAPASPQMAPEYKQQSNPFPQKEQPVYQPQASQIPPQGQYQQTQGYQQSYQQPYQQPYVQPKPKGPGYDYSLYSLIAGIVGILSGLIFCLFGIGLGIPGVIFAKKAKALGENSGMLTGGKVTSIIAIVIGGIGLLIWIILLIITIYNNSIYY